MSNSKLSSNLSFIVGSTAIRKVVQALRIGKIKGKKEKNWRKQRYGGKNRGF